MARQLTPLGRVLVVLGRPALLGYGLYKLRRAGQDRVHRGPRQEGGRNGLADDFGAAPAPASPGRRDRASAAPLPATGGTRLTRPIKVAIVLWGGYAGGIMANGGFAPNPDSVFFKDFGVQVELLQIDDFDEVARRLPRGRRQGRAWTSCGPRWTPTPWSTAAFRRSSPRPSCSTTGAAAATPSPWTRSIKSVADLKGKKLACAEATPSHYFALYVLTQGGLTNRDVEWVFTASAVDAANVFKAGKVDAAVSWSPDVYVAARERQGGHILASTKEASNLIADIFVARGDFLEQHPEDARRFVAGWLKGVEMVEKNPEQGRRAPARRACPA